MSGATVDSQVLPVVVADADPDVVPLMLLVGALAEALASDDPDVVPLTFTVVLAVAVPDVVPLLLPLAVTEKARAVGRLRLPRYGETAASRCRDSHSLHSFVTEE